MEWLRIEHQDNQDMQYRYIGPLIMKDGFKVRYLNIETYSDDLRSMFVSVFYKNGYEITTKYNNAFAYCEITAVKRKTKYIEVALVICVIWALVRAYSYTFT